MKHLMDGHDYMNTRRYRSPSPRETAVIVSFVAFALTSLLALIIGLGVFDPPIHVQLALIAAHAVCLAAGMAMFDVYLRLNSDLRPGPVVIWAGASVALLAVFGAAISWEAPGWMILALVVLFSAVALSLPAVLHRLEREMRRNYESHPTRVLERMNRVAAQWKD
jgi:O-antigen/teichoic acid export membrane protein